ncbi:MAG: hypothetical protein MZV70_06245 [Desulfobacterales bacterium]|nr:hypothetical protein [Desulfobacterales bacterium]
MLIGLSWLGAQRGHEGAGAVSQNAPQPADLPLHGGLRAVDGAAASWPGGWSPGPGSSTC